MSYQARVFKVFIASPSDVTREREIVRSVLSQWNAINAEKQRLVLLPVGWETHGAPDSRSSAQTYINEYVLDRCDILIGVFWTRIGYPTKHHESGTVEEIKRHISNRKIAMLYFSNKPIPSNADLSQVSQVRELKNEFKSKSFYNEFDSEDDLQRRLYDHIQIKINEGAFRPFFDSDILATIKDDQELANRIQEYFPLVARNLLSTIVDEKRSDVVWDAILNKLTQSPADLRDSLLFLSRRSAFRHPVFSKGYKMLANCSQADFGVFLSDLYLINRYEFNDIFSQGLMKEGPFTEKMSEIILRDEG